MISTVQTVGPSHAKLGRGYVGDIDRCITLELGQHIHTVYYAVRTCTDQLCVC